MVPTAAPITPDLAAGIAENDFGRALTQRERRFAAALLAPAFFALLATTTFPLFFLIWTSVFRMDLAMPFTNGFVGFENYRVLLADERFWSSLLVSLIYTASTVILQVVIGLALALLVMDMKRGQGLFRLIAILPVVLSPAVVGMIWRTFMLAPEFGIVDFLSINAGLGSQNWLGDPLLAMVSVILIHTWQWTPFAFMVLLASLAALPEDIYEAARLDRASAWQRFRRITLPLLRPAIVMVIIMRTMVALTAFAAIFTVTGGGPGTATEILNLYAYRKSFTELSIGYGSALAVALLVVTIIISGILFALRRAK
jgi:multiple sugar transport system permease protein